MAFTRFFTRLFSVILCATQLKAATDIAFDWEYVHYTGMYEITLSTSTNSSEGFYVAVAFSTDDAMSDADGYYCSGKKLRSIAIRKHHEPPFGGQNPSGVELVSSSWDSGFFTCTFTRPASVKKEIASGEIYDFNFDKEPYYVLLATGPMEGRRVAHHSFRRVESSPVSFSSVFLPSLRQHFTPINTDGCGKSKVCITHPEGCSPAMPNCTFFTWQQRGSYILMEISGSVGNGEEYVAVGFGNRDEMKNADLYYCTGNDLRSAVIRESLGEPVELPNTPVHVLKSMSENGVAQCAFSRPACVTKEVSGGRNVQFDFFKDPYFVLLAKGKVNGGQLQEAEDFIPSAEKFQMAKDDQQAYTCDAKEEFVGLDVTGCDIAKACLFEPPGCDISSPECIFFSIKLEENSYVIEISGGSGDGNQYTAIGFAMQSSMQDADVYYCTGEELRSAVIRERHTAPVDVGLSGLENIVSMTVNGVGQCSFTRAPCLTKDISGGLNVSFDVATEPYHLLLSRGEMGEDGRPMEHIIRSVSDTPVVFGDIVGAASEYECVTSPNDEKEGSEIDPYPYDVKEQLTVMDSSSNDIEEESRVINPLFKGVEEESRGIDVTKCNVEKACMFEPPGCDISIPECMFMSMRLDEESYKIELSGGRGNGSQYVAVGFARHEFMEDADIYLCTGNELKSAVIRERHNPPVDMVLTGLRDIVSRTVNGVGQCSFTRAPCLKKEISGGVNDIFDISSEAYYLLMAYGDMDEGGHPMQHIVRSASDSAGIFGDVVGRASGYACLQTEAQEAYSPGSSATKLSFSLMVVFGTSLLAAFLKSA